MIMNIAGFEMAQEAGLSYRRAGSGPAVVLIHGFPEDGGQWERLGRVLAHKYTVFIPDLPGSGQSPLDDAGSSMETIAEAILAMIRRNGLDKVVLAGHSMGGYAAMALVAKYPDIIAGLALIHSTATADSEEKKQLRRKSIELIRKGGLEPFIKQMVPNLFSTHFRSVHPDTVQAQIDKGLKLTGESMVSFYNAMINRPDRTSTLKQAKFPVQWVIGSEDTAVPPSVVFPQLAMADVNFVSFYEDVAHMSM